jgi:hypothetical protein
MPSHAARASAAAVRSTGARAYVHEESYLTFRCRNQPLAPIFIGEFAMNSIVNGTLFLNVNLDSALIATSAAARQSSNSSAANPRSSFVAHSHTPARLTHTRVNTPSHVHTYDARPDKPVFNAPQPLTTHHTVISSISAIEQFKHQNQPLAPVYIEEFATNSIVISTTSVTAAAITAIAGNKDARTGDAQTGLAPIFNKDKVNASLDAQIYITGQFGGVMSTPPNPMI